MVGASARVRIGSDRVGSGRIGCVQVQSDGIISGRTGKRFELDQFGMDRSKLGGTGRNGVG